MLYILRFFFYSKCSSFHNANLFGSCIIHILYTGCAEIKEKNNSGAKGLIFMLILCSIFFGKFSTEQPQKIGQILLKFSDWGGYNKFETDCTISFTDKKIEQRNS